MNNTLILNPSFSIKRYLSLRLKFNLKLFWMILFIFIFIFSIFCIFQITEMTKAGYLTETYEQEISQLLKENKVLEIASFQVGSLDNLESQIKNLNYEKVDKIHYIKVLESQIVTK